mmetsp:Transcript_47455/g.141697  ORF Transcript_47455/g.141697 Transcript_47455/m.141697 type:complete len:229 (+) Transcript_47455:445-1131(+)
MVNSGALDLRCADQCVVPDESCDVSANVDSEHAGRHVLDRHTLGQVLEPCKPLACAPRHPCIVAVGRGGVAGLVLLQALIRQPSIGLLRGHELAPEQVPVARRLFTLACVFGRSTHSQEGVICQGVRETKFSEDLPEAAVGTLHVIQVSLHTRLRGLWSFGQKLDIGWAVADGVNFAGCVAQALKGVECRERAKRLHALLPAPEHGSRIHAGGRGPVSAGSCFETTTA